MNNTYIANKKYRFSNLICFVFAFMVLVISVNLRADTLDIEEKIVINASAKAVWALAGGFKAIDRWHPDVADSTLIGTGKEAGDIRVLKLNNDKTIVEMLESYDENEMIFQYRIIESPLPVENYIASITVMSKDDNSTEIIWRSSFNAAGVSEGEAKELISGIYLTGLNALKRLFK